MSREILYARFPDGTVRYGVYDGSSDVAHSSLFASREEAWAWWDAYRADAADARQTTEPGQPVELATIGWHWTGWASADRMTLGAEDFGLSTVGRHYGLPCWVAYDLAGRSGLTGAERADKALALLDTWQSRYADPDIGSDEGVCESCGHVNDWDALHSATPGVYCDDCAYLDGWDCDCEPCAESRELPD
jgi:hypothetical protein